MSEGVWMSRILRNYLLSDKLGLRHKWRGQDWEKPYPRHVIPDYPKANLEAARFSAAGHLIDPALFPEASAVYYPQGFKRTKQIFYSAYFTAVKEKLAKLLMNFDLGQNSELVPYAIFHEDEKTPMDGAYYWINFNCRKDSFEPQESKNISRLAFDKELGRTLWTVERAARDYDIAVSSAALAGCDWWIEVTVRRELFLSDRLATAIRDANLNVDFELIRCRLV